MTEPFIYSILTRHNADVKHFMSYYNNWKDEWFTPNGIKFQIATEMHEFGLLGKKRTPVWNNGSFQGFKIEFKKL